MVCIITTFFIYYDRWIFMRIFYTMQLDQGRSDFGTEQMKICKNNLINNNLTKKSRNFQCLLLSSQNDIIYVTDDINHIITVYIYIIYTIY